MGGLERLVVDWAKRQARDSALSVTVCCLDRKGDLAAELPEGVVISLGARRGRFPFDLAALRKLRGLLSDDAGASTVLHCHNLAAWQYGVMAAIGSGARIIFTQHGANVHNWNWRDRLRTRLLACRTSRLVAVAGATAEVMTRQFRLPGERTVVIPNGVDSGRFLPVDEGTRARIRREMKLPEKAFVIGSTGRLSSDKNYGLLISAFAEFSAHLRDKEALLIIIGDGPEKPVLEDLIRKTGLGGRCVLAGLKKNVLPWLQAMDVFCLSSDSEGMSVSLLEAASCAIPIVATDVGGNSEIVEDGVSGILVRRNDKHAIVAAFHKIAGNGDMAAEIGRIARRKTLAHFSMEASVSEYRRLYDAVLKERMGENEELKQDAKT